MFVSKAAVVGAGTMGGEIAQAIAAAEIPVVVIDGTTGFDQLGDVDLVVEAAAEQIEPTLELFAELDAATPGHAILASSTSSLSITELAEATLRPDKVVGFHCPVGTPLVEVVAGEHTSEETATAAYNFAQAIRKQAIVCGDAPGFVVNRVLAASDGEEGDAADGRALVEACLLVEEGLCSVRDVDVAMIAGAGRNPRKGDFPPFWKADLAGLDTALASLERLAEQNGERFAPPRLLRRLVAQGRLGAEAGQGFYPYPRPDEGEQAETVKLETRGEVAIAWLANAPMNAISPDVIRDLGTVWGRVKAADGVEAMVIASTIPLVFSAGADIKAFTTMDAGGGEELLHSAHALFRDLGSDSVATIAAVNALAFGGGCELAMACDVRIAAEAAVFGQPEIKLGIIPGFGGTQRLPRLVGPGKALEMNLVGDAILAGEAVDSGLANRVIPDHELFETALMWGRKLAAQAPIAREQIKRASHKGELDEGIRAEKEAFGAVFGSEDAKEGIAAFLGKRTAKWSGR